MDDERKGENEISYGKFDDLDMDSEAYLDKVKGAIHNYLTRLSDGPISKTEYMSHPDGLFWSGGIPYIEEVLGISGLISYRENHDEGYYGLTKAARDMMDISMKIDGENGKRKAIDTIIDNVAPLAIKARKESWEISLSRERGKWIRWS